MAAKWSQSPFMQLSFFLASLVVESTWLLAMHLLRPHGYGERMHKHMGQVQVPEQERERERNQAPSFPWDYISLGVGQTRCLFKMTNRLETEKSVFMLPLTTRTYK